MSSKDRSPHFLNKANISVDFNHTPGVSRRLAIWASPTLEFKGAGFTYHLCCHKYGKRGPHSQRLSCFCLPNLLLAPSTAGARWWVKEAALPADGNGTQWAQSLFPCSLLPQNSGMNNSSRLCPGWGVPSSPDAVVPAQAPFGPWEI